MDNEKKYKMKKVYIILSIICVVLAFAAIGLYKYLNGSNKMIEIMKTADDKGTPAQKNTGAEIPVVYNKSDLDRIVGVELREREREIDGYRCMEYWNNRNTPTKYDDLRFYVFDDAEAANKALEQIKSNSFYEITDEGDNYVRGWLANVCDADIESYYYVHGNLMVMTDVTCVDESARSIDDTSPSVYGGGEEALEKIKLINDTF